MNLIFPLIYILLFNASLVIITKKTFGRVLPLTFFISILSIFLSGIVFNTFNIGIVLNYIFCTLPIICLIFKRQLLKPFLKNYFTNGFFIFIILFLITLFFDLNRSFTRWDEFSHWGEMVKEMFRLDKLYCINDSVLQVHKDYPPIVSIFELLWIKLAGSYRESFLIQSVHVFELSLFIPFIFERQKSKDNFRIIINSIFIFLLVFISICIFDHEGIINTIYIDYIMAIIASYGIISIVLSKNILSKFSIINLCLTCSVLVLTKQMGLPFFLIIICAFFAKLTIDKDMRKDKLKKIVISSLIMIFIPLLFSKTWNIYSSSYNTNPQFKVSDINLTKLPEIVGGVGGKEYQIKASQNFLNALYATGITAGNINLTYVQSITVLLIILFLLFLYSKKKLNSKYFSLIGLIIVIGAVMYTFIMLNLYVFNFDEREAPILASYDRYMASYVIFCLSMIIMTFINTYSSRWKITYIPVIIVLVLLLTISPADIEKFSPALIKAKPTIYEFQANSIKKTVKSKKVFIISQNSLGQFQFYLKYYANPIIVNLQDYDLNKYPTVDYKNKMKNEIQKYDYLFLASLDGTFFKEYNSWFIGDICIGCLYENNGDKFVKIDTGGM